MAAHSSLRAPVRAGAGQRVTSERSVEALRLDVGSDDSRKPGGLDEQFLPAERLAAGYLALTGVLVLLLGRPLADWWPVLAGHVLALTAILRVPSRLPRTAWGLGFRAFLPVIGLPFIYLELRKLTGLYTHTFFDRQLRVLELAIFPSDPGRTLFLQLPWKALGEYLMATYSAYYLLLPILAITLYRRRRHVEFGYSVATVFAVYLFCYLCFIAFPVYGPFFLFDPPEPERIGWLFPQIAQSIVARGASPGATFPSSHVAAAIVMWLLAWRFARPLFLPFSVVVPGLVVGTVYGGFHYAVDALAGVLVGLAGYLAGPTLWRLLRGPAVAPAMHRGAVRGLPHEDGVMPAVSFGVPSAGRVGAGERRPSPRPIVCADGELHPGELHLESRVDGDE